MNATLTAALELDGTTLRHATVDARDAMPRVRHLGSWTADQKLAPRLLHAPAETLPRDVGDALTRAFQDTEATTAVAVVHPADVCAFFAPVPAALTGDDRKRALLQHVALLTGTRSTREIHLEATPVRTARDRSGEEVAWMQALVLRREAHRRLEHLLERTPIASVRWRLSTEAAARVVAHVEDATAEAAEAEAAEAEAAGLTLAVGQYLGHTEYGLVQGGTWYHSHHAPDVTAPQDRAYHLVALLNRIGTPLHNVERLFVYGETDLDTASPLEAVVQAPAERLDPGEALAWAEGTRPSAAIERYVPCLGGGLPA